MWSLLPSLSHIREPCNSSTFFWICFCRQTIFLEFNSCLLSTMHSVCRFTTKLVTTLVIITQSCILLWRFPSKSRHLRSYYSEHPMCRLQLPEFLAMPKQTEEFWEVKITNVETAWEIFTPNYFSGWPAGKMDRAPSRTEIIVLILRSGGWG